MPKWPVHARIDGPIVMIGFGSIGKGTLPLIERHFHYDKKRFVVIDPEDKDRKLLDQRGIRFIHQAVTKANYRHLLTSLLTAGGGQGFESFLRRQGVRAQRGKGLLDCRSPVGPALGRAFRSPEQR